MDNEIKDSTENVTKKLGRPRKGGTGRQGNLIISLPFKGGLEVREALKNMAEDNSRSLSNQTFIVLKEYLEKEGLI